MMFISKKTMTGLMISALALGGASAHADVVVVVSGKSTASALTQEQVADIFLGKSTQLPGAGRAVPIDQGEGSAARETFYAKGLGKTSAQLNTYWSKRIFTGKGQPPKTVGSVEELKSLLANNPDAIGYIDESSADDSVKVLFTLK